MEIILNGKRSGIMKVSSEDYSSVSQYTWHITKLGYIKSQINNKKILLHRFITDAPDNTIVDHFNGNKLDNTRENLTILTYQQNSENKRISKSKISSKFMGVYYNKSTKKYMASCHHNGKLIHLGAFEKEIDAAETRDTYIIHNNLSHIQLNFPEKKKEHSQKPKIIVKTKRSAYRGVTKDNTNNVFIAHICINNKNKYLIRSKDEIECAKAYDKYIVENNVPCKKLNFPSDNPSYNPNSIIKTLCEDIDEKTVRLLISDSMIIIDREDYDIIKYYKCYINNHSGYVNLTIDDKTKKLHRIIMKITDPKIYIDHIDNNKLNNSKSNLRISNAKKNAQNKSKAKNTTSQYFGLQYSKIHKKWLGKIIKNNKAIFTAYDTDEIKCAVKRDLFIIKNLKNDCYKLNFEWENEQIIMWESNLKEEGYEIKYLN